MYIIDKHTCKIDIQITIRVIRVLLLNFSVTAHIKTGYNCLSKTVTVSYL